MDAAALDVEYEGLIFGAFDEVMALTLGQKLVELGLSRAHPIVIDIRTADRTLYHAALPGSAPLNDLWALRKSNTALMFQKPSMLVTASHRAAGRTVEIHGLDPARYVDSGGAVPIRVRGVGVVAVATVSGLPELEDHKLVVEAIRAFL
ncbi:MAG: hypothetical protein RLZZ528_2339 [Pseudomonadota bacterium]|jgi:uncharacterized protein (UPF0303 family)